MNKRAQITLELIFLLTIFLTILTTFMLPTANFILDKSKTKLDEKNIIDSLNRINQKIKSLELLENNSSFEIILYTSHEWEVKNENKFITFSKEDERIEREIGSEIILNSKKVFGKTRVIVEKKVGKIFTIIESI